MGRATGRVNIVRMSGERQSLAQRMMDGGRSVQGVGTSWKDYGDRLYPIIGGASFEQMRSIATSNVTLFTSIVSRASMAVDSGFFVERNDDHEDNQDERKELSEWAASSLYWRSGGGIGGMCEVLRAMLIDRNMFGAGFIECLPPRVSAPSRGGKSSIRTAGVSHLPRMNVRMLRPVAKVVRIGRRDVSEYNPDDILYPQLVYCESGVSSSGSLMSEYRHLKAMGDNRKISMYTGDVVSSIEPEEEATEYMRIRNYFPGYEEGCPDWWPALQHIDVCDAAPAYYVHVLRNNVIPDLAVILKGVGSEDEAELVRKMENKFRELRQRRKNLGNYTNVLIFSLVNDSIGEEEPGEEGQRQEMGMEFKPLNPIDGNVIRAMLDLEKRAEQRIAMAMRMPNQLLNYERNTGLGSGAEITSALHMLTKFVLVPDQERVNSMLRRICSEGRGINSHHLRLDIPDYNDPETEARIASMWGMARGLTIDEVRDKIGFGSLTEALSKNNGTVDVGKVMIIPKGMTVLSLSDLEFLASSAFGYEDFKMNMKSGDIESAKDAGVDEHNGLPDGDLKNKIALMLDDWFASQDGSDTKQNLNRALATVRATISETFESMGFKVE